VSTVSNQNDKNDASFLMSDAYSGEVRHALQKHERPFVL
jgi:hypothetical protein